MNNIWAKDAYLNCVVPKKTSKMLLKWLLMCIGGYTTGKRNISTNNAKREDWLTHLRSIQRIVLYYAFPVLRIYCTTHLSVSQYDSIPPSSPPIVCPSGDFVNIFGNFKVMYIDGQAKENFINVKNNWHSLLLKFWYKRQWTPKRHHQTVVTAIYWCKNEEVNF